MSIEETKPPSSEGVKTLSDRKEGVSKSPEVTPDVKLGNEILAVLQADDPERMLAQKILERKLESEMYEPVMRLLQQLRDVSDLGERTRIVDQLSKEGVLTPQIQHGVLTALLKLTSSEKQEAETPVPGGEVKDTETTPKTSEQTPAVLEVPEELKGKSQKDLEQELSRTKKELKKLRKKKASMGIDKNTKLLIEKLEVKKRGLMVAVAAILEKPLTAAEKRQEAVVVNVKIETFESPEEKSGKELTAVLQADDPEKTLLRKILEKDIEPDAYQPIMRLLDRIKDVFDLGERAKIVDELSREGAIPPTIERGLLRAFLKDDSHATEFLRRFAAVEYKKAEEVHGEEIPHEALVKAREKLLLGFVAEAEKLQKQYSEEGRNVPEAEIQKLRGSFNALPKPFQSYIRNELGSIVLSQAEVENPEKNKFLEHTYNIVRMITGEDQERLTRSSYGLYEILYGFNEKRGTKVFARRPPTGRPPFHITGLQELTARAWEYETENPNLVLENKKFSGYLAGIEDFLLEKGPREIKEQIRKRRQESEEHRHLRKERRVILDTTREVAEKVIGGEEGIIAGLKGSVEALRGELKADVVRLAISEHPVYEQSSVMRILQAVPTLEKIKEEVESLEIGGSEAMLEKIYIPPGAENRYTSDAFNKLVEARKISLEREFLQTSDLLRRGELERLIAVAKIIIETEDSADYSLRMRLALTDGIITQEEYQGFLNFIEVNAAVIEAKARAYEAETAFLQNEFDPSRLSEARRQEYETRIVQYIHEAERLNKEAAEVRRGKKEQLYVLKK